MIIEPDLILTEIRAASKKHALEEIARLTCQQCASSIDCAELLEKLLEREKIGSTAIGEGVAIPHVKLSTLTRNMGVFVRLDTPVDFGAPDGRPVDLIYVFLAPEAIKTSPLLHLSRISNIFRDLEFCALLRSEQDDLHGLIAFRNSKFDLAA